MRELMDTPNDVLDEILQMRAYAYCHGFLKEKPSKRPQIPLMSLCAEIDAEVDRDLMAADGVPT